MSNRETELEAAGSHTRDALSELPSHERRRRVLACLREYGSLALSDLADEVARREHDAALPQVPETEELCVFLSLAHVHVPKLAEADVVSYEPDRGLVALAEEADALGPLPSLESTTRTE